MQCKLLAPAVLLAIACSSSASPSAEEVEQWLDAELAAAASLSSFTDAAITFRYESHWPRPPAEIEKIRQRIERDGANPDAWLVAFADKIAAHGPDVSESTIRLRNPSLWRISTNFPGLSIKYRDTVVTPTEAWELTSQTLTLIDHRLGWPEGKSLDTNWSGIRLAISRLFFAGLAVREDVRLTREPVTVGDEQWICRIQHSTGEVTRLSGTWDARQGRGFVLHSLVEQSKYPEYVGSTIEFSEWRHVEAIDRWAALRAEQRFADGSLTIAHEFVRAVRETPEVFEACIATPEFDGSDPIRGPLTVSAILDHSKADYVQRMKSETGFINIPIGSAPRKPGISMRQIGWLAAGAVLTALVAIRLWRVRPG